MGIYKKPCANQRVGLQEILQENSLVMVFWGPCPAGFPKCPYIEPSLFRVFWGAISCRFSEVPTQQILPDTSFFSVFLAASCLAGRKLQRLGVRGEPGEPGDPKTQRPSRQLLRPLAARARLWLVEAGIGEPFVSEPEHALCAQLPIYFGPRGVQWRV